VRKPRPFFPGSFNYNLQQLILQTVDGFLSDDVLNTVDNSTPQSADVVRRNSKQLAISAERCVLSTLMI
jgi:hypothetical protein